MKKTFFTVIISIMSALCGITAQTPAFPGAYGGGMYTTGGRGGKVLYVTSLADGTTSDVGTFRWAVSQKYPRIVVFKVSGTIELKRKLSIKEGNLTIAGQSAPGDGICIRTHEVTINADNVIMRYLRFRLGNADLENESDALGARRVNNVIIDHCSMSWSIDECASFYENTNFTLQWCIISESLTNAGHSKGAHGYGGIWGGENATFHHNLLADHLSRNPRFNGWKRSGLKYKTTIAEERVDFRNNVVFNWGDNGCYGGEGDGHYNVVNNYFKPGPATKESKRDVLLQIDMDENPDSVPPGHGSYYITGNYLYGQEAPMADNWKHVAVKDGVKKKNAMRNEPFASTPIMEHSAEKAFMAVISYAGANYVRDAVDLRIAQETMLGRPRFKGSVSGRLGLIDTPEDVGGYPVYYSDPAPADENADGIPDQWFTDNVPAGKTANDLDANGYTYVEVYLNSLVAAIADAEYDGAKLNK